MRIIFILSIVIFYSSHISSQIGFQEKIIFDNSLFPNGPLSVFSADLDGDGDLDVLSSSGSDDKIAWYKNLDGQGNFGPQLIISTSAEGAFSIFSIDLDGDGDSDVLSASFFDDKIAWYENLDGQGNFGPQIILNANADGANAVYAADADNDGDIDVFSASFNDNTLAWYENLNGQGNFSNQKIISNTAEGVKNIHVADINNDNALDVVSSSDPIGFGNYSWYENLDGQGSFGIEQVISSIEEGNKAIFAKDLDNDGDLDIVSCNTYLNDNGIMWYENIDGQGDFSVSHLISDDALLIESIYPDDIDGDGDIDLIAALSPPSNERIVWFENTDGQGSFGPENIVSTIFLGLKSVYSEDIDGDGDKDIVSGSANDDKIAWYENIDGQGNFGPQKIITINPIQKLEGGFFVDINNDGDIDVLTASSDDDKITWYENIDGLGTYGPQNIIANDIDRVGDIFSADIDGDGDFDVISATRNDDKVVWYENQDGLGDFSSEIIISSTINYPLFVSGEDLDGDTDIDLVVGSGFNSRLYWLENTGTGFFNPEINIATYSTSQPPRIYIKDLDGDDDMDIISVVKDDDFNTAWHENIDGLGTFSEEKIISSNVATAGSAFIIDIDGDGDNDVLSTLIFEDLIVWYENLDGLGNFSQEQIINENIDSPNTIYAEDIDNDGDFDVICSTTDKLIWYENLDDMGAFGEEQIISTNINGGSIIFTTDLNYDGSVDVFAGALWDDKISWFENLGLLGNRIIGSIRLDVDADGCDNLDLPVPELLINAENGVNSFSTFTQDDGSYLIYTNDGNFATSITSSLPNYFTSNPITDTAFFIGSSNLDTISFCLEASQIVNDLNIALFPLDEARPGFNARYMMVYRNTGSVQINGDIKLDFTGSKLNFFNSNIPPTSQTNNSLSFEFDDLNPLESRVLFLSFDVFPPPTVNIDEVLNFTATVNPILNDLSPGNNSFELDQIVIGSFDPNDIIVLEGDKLLLEETSNYLHYLIRFQNTGTASAINVRIENVLDSLLDWNTFQVENSSHPQVVEIKNRNEVSFIFDGIHLPDSTSNKLESHGFISYKIKPKTTIQLGDIISNQAAIFFDFNEAIITNMVTTEIVEPTSSNELPSLISSIFPVPVTDILYVKSIRNIDQLEIYNQLGVVVFTDLSKSNLGISRQVDVSSLTQGLYFLKIRDQNSVSDIKAFFKN